MAKSSSKSARALLGVAAAAAALGGSVLRPTPDIVMPGRGRQRQAPLGRTKFKGDGLDEARKQKAAELRARRAAKARFG
jgi:hypothetical protein